MSQPIADRVEVVRLDRSISRVARSLLYNCYRHEPLYQHLLEAHRPGYKQRIRATIRELIRLHFDRNEAVLGIIEKERNRLIGIVFVSGVELKMDISDQMMWRLKMFLTTGYECTRKTINYINDVQNAIPSENHRMITLIGIHPEYQKQGLGRLMIEAVHNMTCEEPNSIGLFIDTGNSRYKEFFKSMGYDDYQTIKVGDIEESIFFRPNPCYKGEAA
jgi:GNAT superfamily N-acetyltransferase